MKTNKFFKALFWILTMIFMTAPIVVIFFAGAEILQSTRLTPLLLLAFIAPVLLFGGMIALIAGFVYRDAPKRGMDRWMWMTIAVYVPNLIGLIIYFITRSNNSTKCLNCGKSIKSEFEVCPYCSTQLNTNCPQCGKKVLADWQVCPYCKNSLQ